MALPKLRAGALEFTFERSQFRRRLSRLWQALRNRTWLGGVQFAKGVVFMEKAFSPSTVNRLKPSRIQCDADHPESDLDNDVISLLEENARLRALVTQLSDLVLRHVVDQK